MASRLIWLAVFVSSASVAVSPSPPAAGDKPQSSWTRPRPLISIRSLPHGRTVYAVDGQEVSAPAQGLEGAGGMAKAAHREFDPAMILAMIRRFQDERFPALLDEEVVSIPLQRPRIMRLGPPAVLLR